MTSNLFDVTTEKKMNQTDKTYLMLKTVFKMNQSDN